MRWTHLAPLVGWALPDIMQKNELLNQVVMHSRA